MTSDVALRKLSAVISETKRSEVVLFCQGTTSSTGYVLCPVTQICKKYFFLMSIC